MTQSAAPARPSVRHESGRQVVALGFALAVTAVALDLLLSGSITLFFDLCFVSLCCALAWRVRMADFFAVGVLPPLLMLGVFALLAMSQPSTIAHHDDGFIQATITGLARHSAALAAGYAVCLATLAYRQRRGH